MAKSTEGKWLSQFPVEDRERAAKLLAQFQALDAHEAESWAESEVSENIAQLARFAILRAIWRDEIDPFTEYIDSWLMECRSDAGRGLPIFDQGAEALERIEAAGVDKEDLGKLARWIAQQVAFGVINRIDEGNDPQAEGTPQWKLMELTPAGEPTGRDVGGLHESLLEFEEARAEAQE